MEILATETEMIGLEGDVGEDRMERRGGGIGIDRGSKGGKICSPITG